MKILFPIGSFYPAQLGGPSNTIYWNAKALKSKGQEPVVVATDIGTTGIQANQWLDTDCGKVIYIHVKNHLLNFRHIRTICKNIPKVDVVQLTSLFYPPSFLVGLYAAVIHTKVVWSPRGELSPAALQYGSVFKKVILLIIKAIKGRVVFHVTSEQELQDIRNIMGDVKTLLIPNYMELPPKRERMDRGNPYFLYLGRIHPIKALDNLIGALVLSNQFQISEFNFKIAGDGDPSYVEKLQILTKEAGLSAKVHFIGRVEGSEKEQLFANAHFSILPSHSENFGNVVIESLAQGTPVVASKGTPWSVLENRNAGFWVNNSPENLCNTIERIISLDSNTYEEFRKNAFNLAIDDYDVYKNVNIWIHAYNSVMANC